jgi:hypothetical protein
MKTLFILLFFFSAIYQAKAQTRFIWPVKAMPEYGEVSDFYATNNFVDQNTAAGVQDWNCGARTYNGHRGIDIDLWPFTWSMMDNNYVAVIAAASGRVVSVTDNLNNENNCGQAGENTNWNFIAIRHADSSTSIYGHIRTNSARVVVGQNVSVGQLIAFVGSSGNSSNPHLHFEVNSTAVTNSQVAGLVDPYTGACNTLNAATWWQNQKPYWEPAIVRVMTHRTRPSLTGYNGNSNFCRAGEAKNARADFGPNDSIYFGVAMRDYLQNQSFTIAVFDPGGGQWFSETNTNTGLAIPRRYYVFDRRLPGNAASGTYRVVVTFNGTSSVYFFSINCPATQNVTGAIAGQQGFKASSSITSTASINAGNRLFLQAGARITLSPGFVARDGSALKARIRDCNYSE